MKNRFFLPFTFLLFCSFSWLAANEVKIEQITTTIITHSKDGSTSGVSKKFQQFTEQLQKIDQSKVIATTLPLLNHHNKRVRYLASYIALECSGGLEEKHLDTLIKSYKKERKWLPGAILRIKSEKAVKFLCEDFCNSPYENGQIDWVVAALGVKATPYLLEHIKQLKDDDPHFFKCLIHVLKKMKHDKKEMVLPLLKIAKSKKETIDKRRQVILTIGAVGKAAEPYFSELNKLAEEKPSYFKNSVRRAIIDSKTFPSAQTLVKKINAEGQAHDINKLAALGKIAQPLGSEVVKWLDHPNPKCKLATIGALANIHYLPSQSKLEELLFNKTDWRCAFSAAHALKKFNKKSSLKPLHKAAKEHWFPIVREACNESIQYINANKEEQKKLDQAYYRFTNNYIFIERDNLKIPLTEKESINLIRRSVVSDISRQSHPKLYEKFLLCRASNGKKWINRIKKLDLKKGFLLGATAGEWWGSLQYVDEKGNHTRLFKENVTDMLKWNNHVYIATGIYHMGMNKGFIYKVIENETGVKLDLWFVLPGAPYSLEIDNDNQLFTRTKAGNLHFESNTKFKYLYSKKQEEKNDNNFDS